MYADATGVLLGKICDLHWRALVTDITNSIASCTLSIKLGEQVYFPAGLDKNIKLKTGEDMEMFKALLLERRSDWLK